MVITEINHKDSIEDGPILPKTCKPPSNFRLREELNESSWFYRLVALMFGFTMVIIGDVLYNFPSAPINKINPWSLDDLTDPNSVPWMILEYMILLSFCALLLAGFAALCLQFRSKRVVLIQTLVAWQQECLWAFILISLIVAVIVYDWYIFDGRNAVLAGVPYGKK